MWSYPSVNKEDNKGEIDEMEGIDVNSIKKPITEPSKIELAEDKFDITSSSSLTV